MIHPSSSTTDQQRPGSGLDRTVPWLIIAAAAVHLAVGFVASRQHWRAILDDGVWNTVSDTDDGRMKALWFVISGLCFVGIAVHARRTVLSSGLLPVETGIVLLVVGLPISIMEPMSGGWSLVVIGVLAVLATRRDHAAARRRTAAPETRQPAGSSGELR